MANLTIRNLDNDLNTRLRERAAKQGHSMEQEARLILQNALREAQPENLAALAASLFGTDGGVELPEHPAVAVRLGSSLEA